MVLSFDEAYAAVHVYCRRILERPQQAEEVLLLQALGRVLAEPVLADRDFPPFPRATRDGYAVRAADLGQNGSALLRVVGQVKAGDSYDLPVGSGEAVEIMTGAAVPQDADAVVMVEYTERKTNPQGHEGAQRKQSPAAPSVDDVLEDIHGAEKNTSALIESDDLVEIRRTVSAG